MQMGLDITCNCGEISFRAGSYSGFHYWRQWLARKLGFELYEYWANDCNPKTPLEPLLAHSDCDGDLTPRECKQMIEPMRELIERCKKELQDPTYRIFTAITHGSEELETEQYYIELCEIWLNAFIHSATEKCKLIFC